MIVKVHRTDDGRKVLAICDNKLIGKCFEEGNKQLDLNSGFYKGEERSEKEVIDMIKGGGAVILNIAGDEGVRLALKLRLVDKRDVIRIKDIPHAQAILG